MNAFAELRRKIVESTSPCNTDFDYSFVESEKRFWGQLSKVSNSVIIVMDIHSDKPLFISNSLFESFQIESSELKRNITDSLADIIHPTDYQLLAQQKFANFCFLLNVPIDKRLNYKNIYQYRAKVNISEYIWVIEQQQVIQLDNNGNARITLSIIDLSPNQSKENKFETHTLNYKTGEILSFDDEPEWIPTISLTEREKEILRMIQEGFLSKEISEQLSISFNTVNTHR